MQLFVFLSRDISTRMYRRKSECISFEWASDHRWLQSCISRIGFQCHAPSVDSRCSSVRVFSQVARWVCIRHGCQHAMYTVYTPSDLHHSTSYSSVHAL